MNLENKTTAQLETRDTQLIILMESLSAYRNRRMSRKDRQFFADAYRKESDAIIEELMRREAVA